MSGSAEKPRSTEMLGRRNRSNTRVLTGSVVPAFLHGARSAPALREGDDLAGTDSVGWWGSLGMSVAGVDNGSIGSSRVPIAVRTKTLHRQRSRARIGLRTSPAIEKREDAAAGGNSGGGFFVTQPLLQTNQDSEEEEGSEGGAGDTGGSEDARSKTGGGEEAGTETEAPRPREVPPNRSWRCSRCDRQLSNPTERRMAMHLDRMSTTGSTKITIS